MTETAINTQISKAVKALLKHQSEQKPSEGAKNLLVDDEDVGSVPVWLVLGLEKVQEDKKVKPVKLEVKHAWRDAEDEALNVCLITKDPHAQYKETVSGLGLKSISKIMGVGKLRTDYKPFEVRRQLCNGYDLFLADERVLPLLPKLLGKTFFDKKKLPIPVDISKKQPEALKKELTEAIQCTTLNFSTGPCVSIKIGVTKQTAAELKENTSAVLEQAIKKIPGGWKNIRSIHMKTATSLSLPVYAPEL